MPLSLRRLNRLYYYFAFYVIQHYVDPAYRFSGLWSFVCYWWCGERRKKT